MRQQLFVAAMVLGLAIAAPSFAQTWDDRDKTDRDEVAGTYTTYGNTTIGPNGSYTRYGNTTVGPNGSSATRFGNTTVTNRGTSYTNFGNTTIGSDGSSAQRYGNMTIVTLPDGTTVTCTQYGNNRICQ